MSHDRCVIVGGGMGGLATAGVASRHFDEVVLVDRDEFPAGPGIRTGTPQANHFHALLPGGLEILSDLFPRLSEALLAGGSLNPAPTEFYVFMPEGKSYSVQSYRPEPLVQDPDFPPTFIQSRAWLEHCVRVQVEAVDNIELRDRSLVRDPIVEDGRVVGVRIDGGDALRADLVIDATGRASRTIPWLEALGVSGPEESVVHCDFAYSSSRYEPVDASVFTDVGCFITPAVDGPAARRGAALIRLEDGSLLVNLSGRNGEVPPRDVGEFPAYAASLHHPLLAEVLERATPIGSTHQFKFPRSVRRHYERLDAFPEGLLPIADAICHYNPVYGQGMSAACRQAQGLGELLAARDGSLDGLWRDFFPVAFEETRAPWLLAAIQDISTDGAEGDFPVEEAEALGILADLSGRTDRDAGRLLADVAMMRRPLSALIAASPASPD